MEQHRFNSIPSFDPAQLEHDWRVDGDYVSVWLESILVAPHLAP